MIFIKKLKCKIFEHPTFFHFVTLGLLIAHQNHSFAINSSEEALSIFPCANSTTCNKRKSVSLKVEEATTSIKEVRREALGGRGRMGANSHWAKFK